MKISKIKEMYLIIEKANFKKQRDSTMMFVREGFFFRINGCIWSKFHSYIA
jgi:hypothetical protein